MRGEQLQAAWIEAAHISGSGEPLEQVEVPLQEKDSLMPTVNEYCTHTNFTQVQFQHSWIAGVDDLIAF